ncbi:unannotated protein [freshwater metagenome]|uniref:Unannotated protein n=1 Tax=freshwater metagenome TaxID=449393 RepID=A0A6J7KJ62_9ZZZZ
MTANSGKRRVPAIAMAEEPDAISIDLVVEGIVRVGIASEHAVDLGGDVGRTIHVVLILRHHGVDEIVDRCVAGVVGGDHDESLTGEVLSDERGDEVQTATAMGVDGQRQLVLGHDRRIGDGDLGVGIGGGQQRITSWGASRAGSDRVPDRDIERTIAGGIDDLDRAETDAIRAGSSRIGHGRLGRGILRRGRAATAGETKGHSEDERERADE